MAASIRMSRAASPRLNESSRGVRVPMSMCPVIGARRLQRQRRPPGPARLRQRFLGDADHQRMAASPAAPVFADIAAALSGVHAADREDRHGRALHRQAQGVQAGGRRARLRRRRKHGAEDQVVEAARRVRAAPRPPPCAPSGRSRKPAGHDRANVSRRHRRLAQVHAVGPAASATSSRSLTITRARVPATASTQRRTSAREVARLEAVFANLNQVCAGASRRLDRLHQRVGVRPGHVPARRDHAEDGFTARCTFTIQNSQARHGTAAPASVNCELSWNCCTRSIERGAGADASPARRRSRPARRCRRRC